MPDAGKAFLQHPGCRFQLLEVTLDFPVRLVNHAAQVGRAASKVSGKFVYSLDGLSPAEDAVVPPLDPPHDLRRPFFDTGGRWPGSPPETAVVREKQPE